MCAKHKAPMEDLELDAKDANKKSLRRKNDYLLRDTFTALAVCHNVTPVEEEGQTTLQVKE